MSIKNVVILENDLGSRMIRALCAEHGINFGDFQELIEAEVEHSGSQRRTRLWDSFDDILDRISEGD